MDTSNRYPADRASRTKAAIAVAACLVVAPGTALATSDISRTLPCSTPVSGDALASYDTADIESFSPVSFASGTFALQPESRHILNELGNALHSDALDGYRFAAVAHVESLGDPSREKKATVLMATAVADYLVDLRGVDPQRLAWSACGATQARADGSSGGTADRRVVIVNLGVR